MTPAAPAAGRLAVIEADIRALIAEEPVFSAAAGLDHLFPLVARGGGFAGLLRLIIEQQIDIRVAALLWARLVATIGGEPTPATLRALGPDTLRRCGFSARKTGYALALADAIEAGRFDPAAIEDMDDAASTAAITAMPGLGPWTAGCFLLLGLGRRDILPSGDLALRRGWRQLASLPTDPPPALLEAAVARWRPRRSAVSYLLWRVYLSRRIAAEPRRPGALHASEPPGTSAP